MVEAWRITKARFARTAFTGEGARLYGGRWTSAGRRAVYVSATASLATLEIAVHLGSTAALDSYVMFPVVIPDGLIITLDAKRLPRDWRKYPAPAALQRLGDEWLEAGDSPVLKVPSAVVPAESNYLLNVGHPKFKRIIIGKATAHSLDPRLVR